jgi:hypothetical protein
MPEIFLLRKKEKGKVMKNLPPLKCFRNFPGSSN